MLHLRTVFFILKKFQYLFSFLFHFNFKQNYIIQMRRIQIWDTGECGLSEFFLTAKTFIA